MLLTLEIQSSNIHPKIGSNIYMLAVCLFFYCFSNTVVSIFLPALSPVLPTPTSHPYSYPHLALSMGLLYMFLDNPSPSFPLYPPLDSPLECRLLQSLWKTVWNFLKKLKMELPFYLMIPLLGLYPKNPETPIEKNLCAPNVHSSVIYNT